MLNGYILPRFITPFKRGEYWAVLVRFFILLWAVSLPFKNAIYQISLAFVLVIFFAHIITHKSVAYRAFRELFVLLKWPILAFLVTLFFMLLSTAINYDISTIKSYKTIGGIVFRFGGVFVALCYFYRLGLFRAKELFIAVLAGIFLLGLTGVSQAISFLVFFPEIGLAHGITGSIWSRTGFGIIIGIGFVLVLGEVLGGEEKKIFSLKTALLIFFGVFVLFSLARSSWVAGAVAGVVLLFLNRRRLGSRDYLFLAAVAMLAVALLFLNDGLQTRLNQLLSGESTNRFWVWSWVLEQVANAPILGHGVNNYEVLGPSLREVAHAPFPHNLILNLLLDLGILGTAAFLWLIFLTHLMALRAKKYHLFAALLYIFVVCMFDIGIGAKDIYSFIAAFCFLAVSDELAVLGDKGE